MKLKTIFMIFVFVSFIGMTSAWVFNGTVRDVNGTYLNNTLVNVTIWVMSGGPPTLVGSNSTTSNATGWFNVSVNENSSWMYRPVVTLRNSTTNAVDYIGQSLPQFPYSEFANTSGINFYLKPAGTINITAVNSTAGRTTFNYQVKDTKLGYSIAEQFTTAVSEAIIYVPRDRNYSIMIYPNQAMPISFDWSNFSSAISYNITAGLSNYTVETHTVQKTFNASDNLIRVSGYILNSSGGTLFPGWNEFTVVPYLLEPGNMIYLGDNAGLPYNMSAWNGGQSDFYNLTTGFYNITLPGPAESATYILFATARNGSSYYGAYKNVTLSYTSTSNQFNSTNLTMYPLMATNWGTSNGNISLRNPLGAGNVNISSAKQQFNLVNSSNQTISSVSAHLEIRVDYSNYGAREFTFMTDISSGSGSFYLPLLNASVKEMNIYSQSYAPKRVSTKTALGILNNPNITMSAFSPGDIDGGALMANIQIALYQSNSTCDVPSPAAACIIADSANMTSGQEDSFNPLSSIIGGGKLSFRMGLLANGIIVEYINVDMLASGPPDALFDDSATNSTSGTFSSAMRFGSNGPTIYDYVLVSIPYTPGSSSVTGLNESDDVNMSIPILYDENWNIIWNASLNGTNGGALAGNYSHYNTYSSDWQVLMGQNNCTNNMSQLNATNPCYIDINANRIWVRLPHFSGTQPSVTGGVVTATSTGSSSSSSSGGGSASLGSFWTWTVSVTKTQFEAGYSKEMSTKQRIKISVDKSDHYVGLVSLTGTSATINVSSTPQQAVFNIGDEKKFDVTDDGYYDLSVKLNSITGTKAGVTIKSISEKVIESSSEVTGETSGETSSSSEGESTVGSGSNEKGGISSGQKSGSSTKIWIAALVVVAAVVIIASFFMKKKRK